jgi:hypothetical protein
MQRERGCPAVFSGRVLLVLRVAVVGAAEEGEIPVVTSLRLRRRIGDERAIRVVREIEPAGSIQALDCRVGAAIPGGWRWVGLFSVD